ncbi:prenyltransferase/squalene oxidase repeat-containing protein [Kitasatospora sp. NPDC101801]|uniref:prenyltransferase/squalene oxidase repeat-containing protein n=1 Tax=Kitasatospora sp. NPDC101801 TaxID=3364103 RepID=UPI0037F84031
MLTTARTGAAALAAALLTGAAAVPAFADTPTPTPAAAPAALYGKGDPTYDGVFRQSLALTALGSVKVVPSDAAVVWLTGQQCADGGWAPFRSDPSVACDPKAEDSNATAMAIQALQQLGGHRDEVTRGSDWLKAVQNADGSWPLNPGTPGDANSTGLAVNALLAANIDPAAVTRNGKNAYDGLALFQLGCAAPAEQRGAFAYQPSPDGSLKANDLAGSQALLAAAGGKLPVTNTNRVDTPPKPLDCATATVTVPHADSAEAAGSYLAAQLDANGQHLMQTMPGAAATPDYTATAWTVLGLVQSGRPATAAPAAEWLAGNGHDWAAKGKSGTDASAAALMLLTAEAVQLDPYHFGGTNTVQLLIDAGPAPKSVPAAAAATDARNDSGATRADDDNGISPVWLVGIGLLVGIGGGLLLSLRRKRAGRPAGGPNKTDGGKSEGDEQK